MSERERPLLAVLPKPLKSGDEIILKGQFCQDPNEFSVNFTIDTSPTPEHIAYHFKVDFERNVIIENYKSTSWYDENVMDNYYFDRSNTEFRLKFCLSDSEISTYQCNEYDSVLSEHYISSFPLVLTLEDIQTVQVWGDIKNVTEITFKYQ